MATFILHNERELLILASKGDEIAFTQLFYAYHNKLGAYVLQLTRSHETAEEIVQDVFIKIWTNREALAKVEHFGSYIYVLSRNHAFNCLRQMAREQMRKCKAEDNIKEWYENENPLKTEEDYYPILDEAVEKLPAQQQTAYILSRRKRLKYEEIAQRMQISRETVKKYLQLANRFIISYVRSHGDMLILLVAVLISTFKR